jgi:ATP-binding cassette subfamily B protein
MLKEPEERVRKEQALDQVRCVIGEIAFKDIALAYKSGREVLKAINLVIPAGQKLGIVGPTGAGKSSLLNLIPGLYVPHEGMVMIDGVDLKAWNLSNLRGQIGYLAQDPFLSHGSLAANILGLNKEQDSQAIAKFFSATESVGLAGVLDRFTGGMNFHIREGGSNLSSGEKQMIAFLRLIYEDRPILLLDEATSCLDRDWESAIQKAILALMKQRRRTCVIIAHRTETLRSCDRIVRIESGRLVADGVPQDVLPRGLDLLFNTN